MPKTKEQIRAYNKEYSARPEVIERAKIKNSRPDQKKNRKIYKQSENARAANYRYRTKPEVVEKVRRRRLEKRYGITYEEFEIRKILQKESCAICATPPKVWHVDHNHATGAVRGLLCAPCNMALGLFKDSQKTLIEAIKYLQQDV